MDFVGLEDFTDGEAGTTLNIKPEPKVNVEPTPVDNNTDFDGLSNDGLITMPKEAYEGDMVTEEIGNQAIMGLKTAYTNTMTVMNEMRKPFDMASYELPPLLEGVGIKLEKNTKVDKYLDTQRKENLATKDRYRKKYGSEPIVADTLEYLPDVVIAVLGAQSVPGAMITEGMLGYGRAKGEGQSDEDALVTAGYSSAAVGLVSKVLNKFTNAIGPKDLRIIADMNRNQPMKREGMADMLQWMTDHQASVNKYIMTGDGQQLTGNVWIDKQIAKLTNEYGAKAANDYVMALARTSQAANKTTGELSKSFAKDIEDSYNVMKRDTNDYWDDVSSAVPRFTSTGEPIRYDISDVQTEINNLSVGAPDTVKNFLKKWSTRTDNELELKALQEEIDGKRATIAEMIEAGYKKAEVKYRKDQLKTLVSKKNDIVESKGIDVRLKDMEELTLMMKNLNNKHYVKGGNISMGDQLQMHYLNQARDILQTKMKSLDGGEDYMKKLMLAQGKSKEIYQTFGYANSGKNMGIDVSGKEMGEVLGETSEKQLKIFRGLLNKSPDLFMEGMETYAKHLSPDTLKAVKRGYMERTMGFEDVFKNNGHDFSQLDPKKFTEGVSKLLDNPDGRMMVKEVYGEDVFSTLDSINNINKQLLNRMGSIEVKNRPGIGGFIRTYTTDLGRVAWEALTNQSNKRYTQALLNAYKSKVK